MAITKLPAKNSEVYIKVGSGDAAKLKSCSDWSMDCQRGTIDVSTLGTEWKEYLTGQIEASGSVTLISDPEDSIMSDVEAAMFEGQEITIYIRPEGSTSGKPEYQLSAFVTQWNTSASTDDAIKVSMNYTGTGAIVQATVA